MSNFAIFVSGNSGAGAKVGGVQHVTEARLAFTHLLQSLVHLAIYGKRNKCFSKKKEMASIAWSCVRLYVYVHVS